MSEKIAKILTVNAILNIIILITYLICGYIDMVSYGTLQGIVIDKQYTTETAYTEYATNYGDKIPYEKYVIEKYKIEIQKTVDGKQKSTWVEVPKDEYNNLNIGDSYGNYKEE